MSSRSHVIILADDNLLLNLALHDYLAMAGHQVISTFSGAEAIQILSRLTPDLVLTDLHMETHDAGVEVLRQVRSQSDSAQLAVIVCSADRAALKYHGNEIHELGGSVLAKPYHMTTLLTTIDEVVEASRSRL